MTKAEKKIELEKFLNEYKTACEKIIDDGNDEGLHPVELIYGVASTGLLAATLQSQGFTEEQIQGKFDELSEKAKELKETLVGENNSLISNDGLTTETKRVTVKKETLH